VSRCRAGALAADGLHARADGFTSLAVLLGVGGVAIGWDWYDDKCRDRPDYLAPGSVDLPAQQ
jgi:hypothetical protein